MKNLLDEYFEEVGLNERERHIWNAGFWVAVLVYTVCLVFVWFLISVVAVIAMTLG